MEFVLGQAIAQTLAINAVLKCTYHLADIRPSVEVKPVDTLTRDAFLSGKEQDFLKMGARVNAATFDAIKKVIWSSDSWFFGNVVSRYFYI
jgi:hypothetical protein